MPVFWTVMPDDRPGDLPTGPRRTGGRPAAAGKDGHLTQRPAEHRAGPAAGTDVRRVHPRRLGGCQRRHPPGVRQLLEPYRGALGPAAAGRAHPVGHRTAGRARPDTHGGPPQRPRRAAPPPTPPPGPPPARPPPPPPPPRPP